MKGKMLLSLLLAVIMIAGTGLSGSAASIVGAENIIADDGVVYNAEKNLLVRVPETWKGGFTVPNTVTQISESAFEGCKELTAVTIPSSVIFIGEFAFMDCKKLVSVTFPESVREIGDYALAGCTSLREVVLPNGLETLAYGIFDYCPALESVTIPAGVIDIQALFSDSPLVVISGYSGSFAERYALENEIGFHAVGTVSPFKFRLSEGGAVQILTKYTGIEKTVTVPGEWDGKPVLEIGEGAFAGAFTVNSVILPETVSSIHDYAFYNCAGLEEIFIPASIRYIGYDAFMDTVNLAAIRVHPENPYYSDENGVLFDKEKRNLHRCPQAKTGQYTLLGTVESIGQSAFEGCKDLTRLTLPEGVREIGKFAFMGCDMLQNINLPSRLAIIPAEAFTRCYKLRELVLPDAIVEIQSYAFRDCTELKSIMIPAGLETMGEGVFSGCGALTIYGYTNSYAQRYADESDIPFEPIGQLAEFTSQQVAGGVAITGYRGLSERVEIPEEIGGQPVVAIADYAFSGHEDLKSIALSKGVTSIGANAFENCTGLTELILPSAVKTVGNGVFDGCVKLQSIQVNSGNTAFSSLDGVLFNASKSVLFRCPPGKEGSYTVPNSVQKINESAFSGCYSLTGISFSLNYTTLEIGLSAFRDCTGLAQITLPSAVSELQANVFAGCTNLTLVNLSEKLKSIGVTAFLDCEKLESLKVPASLTALDTTAFMGCNSLSAFTVAAGNKNFTADEGILYSLDKKVLVKYPPAKKGKTAIPDTVRIIGASAFRECAALTGVTIPSSVQSIGYAAFRDCASLQWVALPESVREIGTDNGRGETGNTFYHCTKLREVIFLNNDMIFGGSDFLWCPTGMTFYSYEGSTAQYYAEQSRTNWRLLTTMKRVTIACPVDVEILDSKNKVVGTVKGNVAEELSPEVKITLDGDKKTLVMPDKFYCVNLRATSEGTMTYSIEDINSGTETIYGSKIFTNVRLTTGKEMFCNLTSAGQTQLFVMSNGNAVKEIGTDGSEWDVEDDPLQSIVMRLNAEKALLDGNEIATDPVTPTVSPFTLRSKTMVPVRFMENFKGVTVNYNQQNMSTTVLYGDVELYLELENKQMRKRVGGKESYVTLQTPSSMVEGKTYVPVREVAEQLGFRVRYDSSSFVIVVTSQDISDSAYATFLESGREKLPLAVAGINSITAVKSSRTFKVGESFDLKAADVKFNPENAGCKRLLYSSSNSSVASVTTQGKVRALKKGSAKITVTSHNGKTTVITVTVL